MNSFKKVSLVIAAALAGTMLAAPSSYAVPTIAVSVNSVPDVDANTVVGAAVVTVPSDNKINAADAVKFDLTAVDTGTVVSVVTSNAFIVTALHDVLAPVTASSGATSYSVNVGTGSTASFFVYTKSTAVGTVTITNAGNTYVYYVKGTAGSAYNLDAAVSSSVATSSIVEYSVKVTDVFGNIVGGTTPTVTVINGTVSTAATASDSITGISKVSVTYPATAGQSAVNFAITATDIEGLPVAKKSVVTFVTVTDLSVALAAEKAAHDATKAALEAEKTAHAATKKALADAEAKAKADADKAKADADKALADAKNAAAEAKVVSDKAIADLNASIVSLQKALASLKKKYNTMATKYKFAKI